MLVPATPTQLPAVLGDPSVVPSWGVNAPSPDEEVGSPEAYETLLFATVSLGVAVPVVKEVDVTVAVHSGNSPPRWSDTVTVPSRPLILAAPTDALPRLALPGTVIDNEPAVARKFWAHVGSDA